MRARATTSSGRRGASGSSERASIFSSSGASGHRTRRRYHDLVDDTRVVSWQLGRPARPFRRVAARCAYGFPAVTEQAPFGADGKPFPTTFYLTCPWLVAGISRVEAEGGVERYSREAQDDDELGASLERADAEQRRLRPELPVGIAGRHRRAHLQGHN